MSANISSLESLALNILKNSFSEKIAEGVDVSELNPCSLLCNKELFLYEIKTPITILTCGHAYHRGCIETSIKKHSICPRPNCKKEVEFTVDATPRSQNTNDLMDISLTLLSDPIYPSSPKKRVGEYTDKLFSKKVKKPVSKEDSPTLQRLIKELRTDVPEKTLPTKLMSESNENSINFLALYQNIINAEETSKKTIQEVILHYFYFGKALEERFNHYKKNNPKRTVQGLVNNEVRVQLSSTKAEEVLYKALEIVASENNVKAQKLLVNFNELINSTSVKTYWNGVYVRDERNQTQCIKNILKEKEDQEVCQIKSNVLDEHIIESDLVLKRKRQNRKHADKEGECSTRELRDISPVDYNENLNETNLSESDHEEKEIDKRNRHESDYDNDYEPNNNSSISSDSDYYQKKKRKINKGKQMELKATAKCDNGSARSLNSISNNITISQDSSMLINRELLPTVIVTNPTTQTPRTPPPRPNVNIQVTPQKSVLFKESITYLQNHIEIDINDQGMIIKDNHISEKISSMVRNWLIMTLTSPKEEFVKATRTPLSLEASTKDHDFRQICEFVLYDFYFMTMKGPLKRDIGERTYIVERIVPLFKAIQSVHNEFKFHWIEVELDCMREVKKIFPKFDLPINQADGLGVRNSSNKAVIFIEVAGGPENIDPQHVKGDSEKLLKEAVFGLVSLLRNYLDRSAEESKQLCTFIIQSIGDRLTLSKLCLISKHLYKVSQIKSATLPFEFIDVANFMAVFELLYNLIESIFKYAEYSELEIQTGVINKLRLSESVDGITVPRIRDWIWLPDSVSAWECKEIQNENS
ncbi:5528_t:CDS:10 [Ambispora gerdemannii]|uniref:5528_t:CDS:1 n=1 Tax=Ambispora gerdemannii TaxID=144530 RepID=A0A9N9DHG3_9GLOM|nr:5528_t:CDS:10 [Ambispora gerdemannii]